MEPPRIEIAPRHRRGYFEARPGDVIGRRLLTVDVRPEEDLTGDFGHIHGVLHRPAPLLRATGLPGVDRRTPVVVVCGNGRASADCAEVLVKEHGFEEVYLLVGGMVRWTAEGRPVARRPTWKGTPTASA